MCSALIDTRRKLYNLGQHDKELYLEIAKFFVLDQRQRENLKGLMFDFSHFLKFCPFCVSNKSGSK